MNHSLSLTPRSVWFAGCLDPAAITARLGWPIFLVA
jgi:hypothetical protein